MNQRYEIVSNNIGQYILESDDELLVSFATYLIGGGFWGLKRAKDHVQILDPHFFYGAPNAGDDLGEMKIILEHDPEKYWKEKGIDNTNDYFMQNIYKIGCILESLATDDKDMKEKFTHRANILKGEIL